MRRQRVLSVHGADGRKADGGESDTRCGNGRVMVMRRVNVAWKMIRISVSRLHVGQVVGTGDQGREWGDKGPLEQETTTPG